MEIKVDKELPHLGFPFRTRCGRRSRKGIEEQGDQDGSREYDPSTALTYQRVDQFFSTKVTHLIVKSVASPSKAKQATKRQSLAPESPKNPFLDKTGVTDLAQKAEALGIKVWTVKSER